MNSFDLPVETLSAGQASFKLHCGDVYGRWCACAVPASFGRVCFSVELCPKFFAPTASILSKRPVSSFPLSLPIYHNPRGSKSGAVLVRSKAMSILSSCALVQLRLRPSSCAWPRTTIQRDNPSGFCSQVIVLVVGLQPPLDSQEALRKRNASTQRHTLLVPESPTQCVIAP